MKLEPPAATAQRPQRPREQVVLFSISGQTFAISAMSVQEIRSADNLGGVVHEIEQPVVDKVRHVVERDGHSYYVISGHDHFHLRTSRPAGVLMLRELRAAVLVDRIEEMAEICLLFSLPHSFQGLEHGWYRGLTLLDGRVLPVVDSNGFLSKEELDLLECATAGLTQSVHARSGHKEVG